MLCPNDEAKQFVSVFASAYKQVAGDPALAGLAVICQWSPKWKRPVFFVGRTQFFGGKSCPVNFARVPDFWCHVMASLGAMGMSHCVDDTPVAERVAAISSGCSLGRGVVALAGWAMLHALNRRKHEGGQHNLNPQLESYIIWWIRHLPVLLARPVPISMEERWFMFSYSDGEGSYAQVGIALWAQVQKVARAGVGRIPGDLRTHENSKRKSNRYNDTFEVEAVRPLLVLTNFGKDLVVCLWLYCVDNPNELSSLIRGGSSVESGVYITGLTWSHIVGVGCMPCFDCVVSASNPTDGLSRERLQGPWTLEPIQLPRALWDEHMVVPASNHHVLTHSGGSSGG